MKEINDALIVAHQECGKRGNGQMKKHLSKFWINLAVLLSAQNAERQISFTSINLTKFLNWEVLK